jgi:hypothetical protein
MEKEKFMLDMNGNIFSLLISNNVVYLFKGVKMTSTRLAVEIHNKYLKVFSKIKEYLENNSFGEFYFDVCCDQIYLNYKWVDGLLRTESKSKAKQQAILKACEILEKRL